MPILPLTGRTTLDRFLNLSVSTVTFTYNTYFAERSLKYRKYLAYSICISNKWMLLISRLVAFKIFLF